MRRALLLILLSSLLVACPEEEGDPTPTPGPQPLCEEPAAIRCEDDLVLDLSLHDDLVSDGAVVSVRDGGDWVTQVDATAGGSGNASANPFVYVKLDPELGATRVDLTDEEALLSMDWDLALRRFVIRLNSGTSGPGCVAAARMTGFEYDQIDTIPTGASYATEDFFDDNCTLIEDGTGLPGSPDVALSGWWGYASCVQTTGLPFVIQLSDGQVVKLVVEAYYAAAQEFCNDTGSGGTDSGNIRIRHAFLEP